MAQRYVRHRAAVDRRRGVGGTPRAVAERLADAGPGRPALRGSVREPSRRPARPRNDELHDRPAPCARRPRHRPGRRGDRARVHVDRDRQRRRLLRRDPGVRRRRSRHVQPRSCTDRRGRDTPHASGRPVHLFGLCAEMAAIRERSADRLPCRGRRVRGGREYRGRPAGGLGDAGVLQLPPPQGDHDRRGRDADVTADAELAERAEQLRNHGASVSEEVRHHGPAPFLLPDFDELGFNYRMTDLQAAVGVVQLEARRLHRRACAVGEAVRRGARVLRVAPGARGARRRKPRLAGVRHGRRGRCADRAQRSHGAAARARYRHAPRDALGADHGVLPRRPDVGTDGFPVADGLQERSMAIPLHNRMTPTTTNTSWPRSARRSAHDERDARLARERARDGAPGRGRRVHAGRSHARDAARDPASGRSRVGGPGPDGRHVRLQVEPTRDLRVRGVPAPGTHVARRALRTTWPKPTGGESTARIRSCSTRAAARDSRRSSSSTAASTASATSESTSPPRSTSPPNASRARTRGRLHAGRHGRIFRSTSRSST